MLIMYANSANVTVEQASSILSQEHNDEFSLDKIKNLIFDKEGNTYNFKEYRTMSGSSKIEDQKNCINQVYTIASIPNNRDLSATAIQGVYVI